MSFEVASGHVSIFPKFASGFGKQIKGELSVAGSDAAKSTGSAFGSHLKAILASQVITKAVGGLTSTFKTALSGGLSRLMGVEEAQAKMRGLGHSAEDAASVVQQAQKAVDGTIYTTAEAATVAASALAAGIKPGDDLDRVLSSVANAASTAGVGMDEMGSIYNKVASVGKAQNDSLQQVADRGIPIYQALADQLGVTTEEVFKMASAGEIGFAEFEQAMTTASGTVAQEMGNTLSGALANTRSALSKIGENLLSGIFPALTPLMLGLREGLKGLQGPALEAGAALGDWLAPKMEILGGWLSNLPAVLGNVGSVLGGAFSRVSEVIGGVLGNLSGIQPVLAIVAGGFTAAAAVVGGLAGQFGPLLGVVARLLPGFSGLSGIVAQLAPLLRLLGGPIGIIGGLLVAAYASNEQFRTSMNELAGVVLGLVGQLTEALLPVLSELASALLPAIGTLLSGLGEAFGVLVGALAPLIAALVEQLAPLLSSLIDAILPPVAAVLTQIADVIAQVVVPAIVGFVENLTAVLVPAIGVAQSVIQALMPVVETIFNGISSTISNAMTIISGIIKTVTGVIKGDWTQVWEGIKQVFSGVLDQIKNIASTAINLVKGIFEAGWNAVKSVTTSLLNGIVDFIRGIPDRITSGLAALGQLGAKAAEWFGQFVQSAKNKFGEAVDFIRGIPGKISSGLSELGQLGGKAAEWFGGFLQSAKEKFGEAVDFVGGIPSKLVGALGDLSGLLVNSGKSLLKGLADGIKRGFSNAVSAVKDGMSNLRRFFPFSPAKEGPFSGSGYTTHSGKALARDFGDAIAGEAGYLQRRAADLMRHAKLSGEIAVGANAGRVGGGVASTFTINSLTVDFSTIDELPKLLRWVESMSRMQRMGVVS